MHSGEATGRAAATALCREFRYVGFWGEWIVMTALMIMWTMSSFGIILITIYVLTGFSAATCSTWAPGF